MATDPARQARSSIAFAIGVRTLSQTAYRLVYPFLPVFARSLGVDLGTMPIALSARAASGAAGPLLAPFTDRHGRRFGLSLGLGLFAAGAFLGAGLAANAVAFLFLLRLRRLTPGRG